MGPEWKLPTKLSQVIYKSENSPNPGCEAGQTHRPRSDLLASPPLFPWAVGWTVSARGDSTGSGDELGILGPVPLAIILSGLSISASAGFVPMTSFVCGLPGRREE